MLGMGRLGVALATIAVGGGLATVGAAAPAGARAATATAAAQQLSSPNCAPYAGGMTVCSAEVPSFDGSPLDVDLTEPMPHTGSNHPLIVLLHGFGNNKHEWESTTDAADGADKYNWNSHWFASHGYYTLTYTARGFKDNGTSAAYQPPTPAGTATNCLPPGGSACAPVGTIRVKNKDVEIRDTQWLAGLAALAFPDINRNEVAVSGGSYGGGESWLQAAEQAGRSTWNEFPQFPWLPHLHLRVAVPKYPWTDLAYSLAPNGHPGSPGDLYSSSQGAPRTLGVGNPFGVGKFSYTAALNALGTATGVFDEVSTSPQTNGVEPFGAWLLRVSAGEPYDFPGRVDDPVIANIRTAFSGWHSAYYQRGWQDGAAAHREPAVFSISGWTDDLFPPVESFRMFNYLKSLDSNWPVVVRVGDVGHSRAQNPPLVWQELNAQAWAFLQDNIAGRRSTQPPVTSYPTVCSATTTTPEAVTADTPAGLAKGRLTVDYHDSAILAPTSGTLDPNGLATDAVNPAGNPLVNNGSNCRTAAGPTTPYGGYTGLSQPLASTQTFVGIGYAQADYQAAPGFPTAVLAERVWDVKPDGNAVLVSRGVYRFDFNGYDATTGTVRVPLYGNHWPLPQGDRIRLDLEQVDAPTYRAPNLGATSPLSLTGIKLILPVGESSHTTLP